MLTPLAASPGSGSRPKKKKAAPWNDLMSLTFLDSKKVRVPLMMLYPWPLAELHTTLNESLEIAMDYLERSGQAYPYSETQVKAADAILVAWQAGVRHRIRLANVGIMAVSRHGGPSRQ
jgi:hypothetical protein